VRPLRDLVTELDLVLAPTGPARPGLARLRERALAVLRAFAAPPAATRPAPARDPQFWRR